MRKQFLFSVMVTICLSFTACVSEHYVSAPPPPPAVVVAPPPPGRVWVDHEYRWRKGKYVLVPGHVVKVRPGRAWVPGHWVQKPKGSVWVPGHWK